MSSSTYKQKHYFVLISITVAAIVGMLFIPPIPQPPEYHQFGDSRTLLGIPNFMDVVSNLLFLIAGIWGLMAMYRPSKTAPQFENKWETLAYALFFLAAILTCFGSAWYHLSPDNSTLVWDRLPITLIIAALLSAVLSEHIGPRFGITLLPLLVGIGIWSVYYWVQTESAGAGDLRPYLLMQTLPALLIIYMLLFLPARYSREDRFGWLIALYIAARAAEYFDKVIFDFTMQMLSGHTIKHILASIAILMIVDMLRYRIPVNKFHKMKFASDNY